MPTYNMEEGSIQHGFYLSRNKVQIFGGAFANGKTTALVIKAINLCRDYPGCNGLIARETFPKLNDTVRKVFLEWCPPAWIKKRPTDSDNTCYLTNGSTVNFRYIAQRGKTREDGSTTSNLLSATYDWAMVDQVEDPGIQYKDFLDLLGRLRGNTPYKPPKGVEEDLTMPTSGPRWLILTSNPTHNWFYKQIVQPLTLWNTKGIKSEGLLLGPDGTPIIDLFEGSTYTNAANLDPDYIMSLETAYKGQMRDRYLLGKWAAFEGLVHPDFDDARHVLSRSEMEAHMMYCLGKGVKLEVIEGYDFGLTSPSCYLFGFVDHYGRVFVIDGYYEPNFHYEAQPDKIHEIRQKYQPYLEAVESIIADPAIFKKTNVGRQKNVSESVEKLLRDSASDFMNIHFRAGGNEILGGLGKVNSYLAGRRDMPHPVSGDKPGPLIFFCDELEFIRDEVYSYYWRRNPQGVFLDEPVDVNDHAMNTIKYMLSKRPSPAELTPPPETVIQPYLLWQEEREAV